MVVSAEWKKEMGIFQKNLQRHLRKELLCSQSIVTLHLMGF